ncbi:MAG: hypothetical protein HW387_887 [Parachlamydiales bacterium]|nr:hypothetical protein [Parachlamydiales bacterium]
MRLPFGYQVLLAVIAGIIAGLFFGPLTAYLRPIGSVYTMLLQMVVLPYVCLSIILGLGSLTPSKIKNIFKKCVQFWILLWALIFVFIYLFCLLIPHHPIGSFLFQPPSAGVVRKALVDNIVTYLIPENPIYDFLNSIVPAIAVFGMIVGFALMVIEKKEPLLGFVEKGDQIIEKILVWLAKISPIGVFPTSR